MAEKDPQMNELIELIKLQARNQEVASQNLRKDLKLQGSQTVKDFKEALENSDVSDEQGQDLLNKIQLMQLGFDEEDAETRVAAQRQRLQAEERLKDLQEVQENFGGLTAKDKTILDQTEFEIDQLLQIEKFGRTLSKMEKAQQTFFGGTFDELIKATEKGGELTAKGIAKSFGDDLRGDFDKITAFLGPAATALSNLPFLGTIGNLLGRSFKRMFANFLIARRGKKKEEKLLQESVKLQKTEIKMNRKELEKVNRDRAKQGLSPLKQDGTPDKRFKQPQDGGDDDGGDNLLMKSLGLAAISKVVNPVLGASFVVGAGKFAIALGLLGAGLGAFSALAGLGLGVLISSVIGGIATGFGKFESEGATDAFERLEKIDMLKVSGGLAALAGASVLQSIAGLVDLLTGGGLKNPFTNLGKDAAGFANAINESGFMSIDMDAFNEKAGKLFGPSLKNSLTGLVDFFTGGSNTTPLTNMGQDAAGFASSVEPFMEMDADEFNTKITKIKNGLTGFELPEGAGIFESMFGADGISKLNELASIDIDSEMPENLIRLGDAVDHIGNSLEGLTEQKAKMLGRIGFEIGKNFDNFNLNFGTIPSTAGAGADLSIANGEQMQQPVNVVNTVQNANNNTNVQKRYNATGSSHSHSRANQILG